MIDFKSGDIVACVCEGASEANIMNILLDENALIFDKSDLLDNMILPTKYRKSKTFQNEYLTSDFDGKLIILSIQDRDTKYKIDDMYLENVKSIHLIRTKPELEMLMVVHFGFYTEYKKQKEKPSKFLSNRLKIKSSEIKSKDFIEKTFSIEALISAIKEYKRISNLEKGEVCLFHLLKDKFKD